MTRRSPRWIRDIERLLPIRSQYIVAGNIRDSFLTPFQGNLTLAPLTRCLWTALQTQGYQFLLIYNPVEGLRPYPNEPEVIELATRLFSLKLQDGAMPMSLEGLTGVMEKVAAQREARCALLIDFASRLVRQPDHLDATEHRFFVAAERLSLAANPIVPRGADIATPQGKARFNPIIWLVNRAQDMPSWFALDSARISTLTATLPDFETRQEAALILGVRFPGFTSGEPAQRDKYLKQFCDSSEGLSLSDMSDIAQLADRQGIPFQDVDDAAQSFKMGIVENPWKKDYLRRKSPMPPKFIEDRVKGQPQAIIKTVDILMRSVMGLTGAHTRAATTARAACCSSPAPPGWAKPNWPAP